MAKKLPNRNEIGEEYKWRTDKIFKNNEEWEESFKKLKKEGKKS